MTKQIKDANGFIEIQDNPISRVGIFDYWGSEIDAPEPGKLYKVYRPAEELSSIACMDSFRGIPFAINHKMLGDGQTAVEKREGGIDGTLGDKIYFKDDTLYANIHAWTDKVKKFMTDRKNAGQKIQLSAGYYSKYDFTPGTWKGQTYDAVQRFIAGNHMAALTGGGRCGETVSVLDHEAQKTTLTNLTITFDNKASEMTPEEIAKIVADGIKTGLAPLIKTMDAQTKSIAAIKQTMDEEAEADEDAKKEKEKKDKEDEETEAAKKAEADEQAKKDEDGKKETQDAAIKKGIADIAIKAELVGIAAPLVGTFDHTAMSSADVAKYATDKLGLSGDPETALRTYAKAIGAKTTVTQDHAPADATIIKVGAFN